MNPKVSLIIPVYKVEKYLPRCLESVAAQTYDNFETILVDDGSPDNCGKMCDEYASTHENVIVLHQENQGLSGARNAGVQAATGEYITFVDSDDYVSDDYIAYLMGLIEEFGTAIAVGLMRVFFFGKEPDANVQEEESRWMLTKDDALKGMLYGDLFGVSACAKCYQKSLFDCCEFPAGKIYEDLATTYKLLEKAECVAYGRKKIYFYGKRSDSIVYRKLSESALNDGLDAASDLMAHMEENNPAVVSAARYRYARKIVEYLPHTIKISKENRATFKRLRKEMKPIAHDVLRDKRAYWLVKVKIIAMKLGYLPTCALIRGTEFFKHFL